MVVCRWFNKSYGEIIMKKLLTEFILIIVLVSGTWYGLSKIDWITLLKIEKTSANLEQKIGDLFWKSLKTSEGEITSDSVTTSINELLVHLCRKNRIYTDEIKIHILKNGEINAFALPNNHVVIYSGLLEACENESEFCGVLSHELAHIQKGHVMNKLVKETGLSVLISMSTGNGNSTVIKKTIEHLSSTAYDRKFETEADLAAVEYMIRADMDPEALANFLYRLSDENLPEQLYWVSTHPESKQRSAKIMEALRGRSFHKNPVLGAGKWIALKNAIRKNAD
jgi:beta-barrel assembly-enhancing protease